METKECSRCGRSMPLDNRYCAYCGNPLPYYRQPIPIPEGVVRPIPKAPSAGMQMPPERPNIPPRSMTGPLVGFALSLCAVVAGILIVIFPFLADALPAQGAVDADLYACLLALQVEIRHLIRFCGLVLALGGGIAASRFAVTLDEIKSEALFR